MSPTGLPQTLALHLGAHKTASTHLQHSIEAAGSLGDFAFAGPKMLRGVGQSLPERFGFPLDPDNTVLRQERPNDALRSLAKGAPHLALSEENFAGKLQTGWGRIPTPLYFTAPQRVAALAAAISQAGGPAIDLCLGLRDPAGYLTSCYSQILHGRRVVQPDKFREKNPFTVVDWVDYVRRLRRVPGVGTLTIWRYEDYQAVFPQICRALTRADQISPLAERIQPRLSRKAMDAVLLAKSLYAGNVVAAAKAAFPVDATSEAYDLYDAADQAASLAFYAEQWAQLTTYEGITALQVSSA